MIHSSQKVSFVFILQLLVIYFGLTIAENITKVPEAIYVFGDSLVDVGNNNYIKLSILKANFPHNGIDYPGRKPTGRFNNGKNAADFLAEKLGLPTSPPYLKDVNQNFPKGVSFASGGAGIFNTTNDGQLVRFFSSRYNLRLIFFLCHHIIILRIHFTLSKCRLIFTIYVN
ncbi:hypothetical protein Leryth_027328 [Lithospermum erythrorhizon]|nr:hypothetical protein Leryth_027328 [Lithospermum erythrorhizon]